MAVQYWVGDFFVDLSRNQITQREQSQTIAPKALAVLTYLAENAGRVVSYDELLSAVWPNTVVTPNTLQRSIAQLRKVLGEDSKRQSYIKTHAKQGYSLECDVKWQDVSKSKFELQTNLGQELSKSTDAALEVKSTPKPAYSRTTLMVFFVGVAALFLIGSYFYGHTPEQTPSLSFDNLRSLTATDDKEYNATYSPDGNYVVFHRYLDNQCGNRLWAKNISTQKETQLTKDWAAYGSHSFSQDGKKLVFLATEACSQPATQSNCYNLLSLNFDEALNSPKSPDLMLRCQNTDIKDPKWIDNNNIALLQKTSNRWKLINYSIDEKKSTDLYNLKDGNLINFDYSVSDDLIAVSSIYGDGQHYIEMLKPDGRILSSHKIDRPQEVSKYRLIFPSFDPLSKQLIFSTGRQLFTLSYKGKVTKINLPFADRMANPEFHPDGKRLLLIKGPYDKDITLMPLNRSTAKNSLESDELMQVKPFAANADTYEIFERSNLGEDQAVFQPGGDLIAFRSERSGEEQVWISDGDSPRQLSHFPVDTYIRGIDWAADGKSILVNANNVLTRIYLDSNQKTFPLDHAVIILYQWDSNNNKALSLARIGGVPKLVEYDLNTSKHREITDREVLWALKSEDGRLIYKDIQGQFWQPGPVEAKRIRQLADQKSKSKSFIINNNVVYAINLEDQLWSYNLDTTEFNIIGKVDEEVQSLSDINQKQLLMAIGVSAKKEVVELTLSRL